jgi:hypothetical protein
MEQPNTIAQYIDAIREGLVCERCGKYVGSLAPRRFLPAPYPVALDRFGPDDEAEALIGFEWHLVNEIRGGKYVVRHPERDGVCVSFREWAASDDDDDDGEGDALEQEA